MGDRKVRNATAKENLEYKQYQILKKEGDGPQG